MKLVALLTTCFLLSLVMHAQEQQPLNPVPAGRQRIAYIDPALLRHQYDSMVLAQGQYASDWKATRAHYDSLLQQELSSEDRNAVSVEFQDKLKATQSAYNKRLEVLEKKIREATNAVMLDHGFTTLRSITQKPPSEQDSDITSLVLEKLN